MNGTTAIRRLLKNDNNKINARENIPTNRSFRKVFDKARLYSTIQILNRKHQLVHVRFEFFDRSIYETSLSYLLRITMHLVWFMCWLHALNVCANWSRIKTKNIRTTATQSLASTYFPQKQTERQHKEPKNKKNNHRAVTVLVHARPANMWKYMRWCMHAMALVETNPNGLAFKCVRWCNECRRTKRKEIIQNKRKRKKKYECIFDIGINIYKMHPTSEGAPPPLRISSSRAGRINQVRPPLPTVIQSLRVCLCVHQASNHPDAQTRARTVHNIRLHWPWMSKIDAVYITAIVMIGFLHSVFLPPANSVFGSSIAFVVVQRMKAKADGDSWYKYVTVVGIVSMRWNNQFGGTHLPQSCYSPMIMLAGTRSVCYIH